MTTRQVILGSGIAALSAAESIRRVNAGARITIVSPEASPFYSRPGLAYLLSGDVTEEQLHLRTLADVEALRVERLVASAVRIDPAARTVTLDTGAPLPYDGLLFAVGAESMRADFPGAELDGVVQVDGMEEARDFVQRTTTARAAVVIGGGSTAMEFVDGLHARGVATRYLMRGERFWTRALDRVESAIVEASLMADGIVLHRNTSVRRALGANGVLVGVELTTGEQLSCDLLAVAVGIRPRVELARAAGIAVDRGILVDEYLETSIPGIFAAGDVAQVYDPVTGVSLLDSLWASALAQGRDAGVNMAGVRAPHRKRAPMNVTRIAGITTTIIGAVGTADDPDLLTITRGQSERWVRGAEAWSVGGGARARPAARDGERSRHRGRGGDGRPARLDGADPPGGGGGEHRRTAPCARGQSRARHGPAHRLL